ncbi:hypothetical protein KO561_02140 [Radiobacillus kanasensis]|uniref:hypothetical protein n=1 Tax=Radiobacillus kanasensis TaxID=2844358 RepID=UPI001E4C23D3|nr:hypothetical protein [Radiobacillus kanasensis]UFT99797.1 hypothetical protein KO561_02140 [Radiobacillus kanasensis]
MTGPDEIFLLDLETELGECPNKDEILLECKMHVYELSQEKTEITYQMIQQRLGSPAEIAKLWEQEVSITPKRTQWLFVGFNISLFIGGSFLTLGYNWFQFDWLHMIWQGLTNIAMVIMMIYFFFWGLLGYEIGKEFGPRGKKLLKRTFLFCILPNLILMGLTIFRLIPYEWFQPLLNVKFILACIISTIFLYPVSWIGYKWGKKASV